MDKSGIDREYFLDEVRDGFFVPAIMKKAWAVSILAYKELEKVCDEIGVGVFFIFGNLIGAIRHGGSIPWDDDIDVSMLASGYQKLKEHISKNGAPGDFQLRDYSDMETGNFFRKWYDDLNPVKNIDKWKDFFGFPYVGITDIMPMDYVPDDEGELERYKSVANLIQELKDYADLMESGEKIDKNEYWDCLKKVEKTLGEKYDHNKDGKASVWAWKMLEEFCGSYGPEQGKDVALTSYFLMRGYARYPEEYVKDYIDVPFEFTTIRVPIGYEKHLREFYGDYMNPRLDGSPHAYPYYKILEKALKDKYDIELGGYTYDAGQVKDVLDSKVAAVPLTDDLLSRLEVMKEAHAYVIDALGSGGSDELEEILISCQQLAVAVGERIEKRVKDSEEIVSVLENYCEKIYGVYQSVTGSDGGSSAIGQAGADELKSFLSEFEEKAESFAKGIKKEDEKKQVLFLVRTPEEWKSLNSIYEAAKNTDGYEVTAVITPCFYKTGDGDIDVDNPVVRNEGYPDDVEFTDFSQYDLEMEHPDIIFFQCPYDGCHDSMLVHPVFYAENLVKYTDKLVLVPPFKVMEVADNDGRSRYTLSKFVRTPGFVYADEIIVQSEGMKDVYVELLSEMTKDIDWKSKIAPIGTAIDDEIYKEGKEREGQKKNVLYYLGPGVVFEYGKKALDRVTEILSYVKEHPMEDVKVLYYTDPATERIIEKYHPDELDAFKNMKSEGRFTVTQFGCMDVAGERGVEGYFSVDTVDGFIGDPQYAYTICRNELKPAMILKADELKSDYDDRTIDEFFREVREWSIEKSGITAGVGRKIWEHVCE